MLMLQVGNGIVKNVNFKYATYKTKQYETKDSFLGRFMNNAKMISEYPDNKQRYAVANDIWKKRFSRYIK